MKLQWNISLFGAAAIAFSTSTLGAPVAITVLNPSFELQNASGTNQDPITDWTDVAFPGSGNTSTLGVRYYTDAQYPNAQESSGPVGADGHQGIYDNDGSHPIYQTLSSDLSLGTYTLTVASGQREQNVQGASWEYLGGSIALYAGGVQLAAKTLTEPSVGTFTDTTVTFTAMAGNAELGQALQIDLQSNGGVGTLDFDNVRLNFAAAPEPPAWILMLGAVALLFCGRSLIGKLAVCI